MDPDEMVAAAETLDIDDLAELMGDLPDTVADEVLKSMQREDRERLEHMLTYDEDTAGRLLNPDLVTVRADVTVDVVLRYLRQRGELPEQSHHVYVVNRRRQYQGRIAFAQLLIADPETPVNQLMDIEQPAIDAHTPVAEVAQQFADHDWVSAPVVDDNNVLLGRITVDDVIDIIREQAEHRAMSAAGLDEDEDLFSPVARAARRRAIWLGINLLTAFLASWVIGNFEPVIAQVVAVAVLMPIVASMGGIAGTQVLTLMVRALALGQVGFLERDAALAQGNSGRGRERIVMGARRRRHRVRRLSQHVARGRVRGGDDDQPARGGAGGRCDSAGAETHVDRSGARRRRDPDDGDRLLRLRVVSRPFDAAAASIAQRRLGGAHQRRCSASVNATLSRR